MTTGMRPEVPATTRRDAAPTEDWELTAVRWREDPVPTTYPGRLADPFALDGPHVVLVDPLGDLFAPHVPFGFVDRAFAVMTAARRHLYAVPTAHPDRLLEWCRRSGVDPRHEPLLAHVWFGPRLSTQDDVRRILPAMEAASFRNAFAYCTRLRSRLAIPGLSRRAPGAVRWIVADGGPARAAAPMHSSWILDLRDDCLLHAIPFLFRSWGPWIPARQLHLEVLAGILRRGILAYVREDGSTLPGQAGGKTPAGYEPAVRLPRGTAYRDIDGRVYDFLPVPPQVLRAPEPPATRREAYAELRERA